MYSTRVTGSNTRSLVFAFCTTSPLTNPRSSSSGRTPPGSSSGVTRNGPNGVVASHVLPWSHIGVRYCQSRMVTSLRTAKPAIAASAARSRRTPDGGAEDDGELGLPVDGVGLRCERDVVVRADERLGVLREQGRVLGQLAAHLEDVGAVVEPDADDLARLRHERCEVGAGRGRCSGPAPAAACLLPVRVGRAARRRRRSPARRAGRRRRGRRPVTVGGADGGELHVRPSRIGTRCRRVEDRRVAEAEQVECAGVRPSGPASEETDQAVPRRDDEHVAALHRPRLVADSHPPGAVEHLEDRRPDLAQRLRSRDPHPSGASRCGWSAGRRRRWSDW